MASQLIGNQPQGGLVSSDVGTLFSNLGTRPIDITCLDFTNPSGAATVLLEVYQPDENENTKIGQAYLLPGWNYRLDQARRLQVGEQIRARAAADNLITWRVSFKIV